MKLLFGIHSHQPFNNFYDTIHEATDKAYYPFLKVLEKYRDIRISIHFSGWLFEWIKNNRKEVFNLIKKIHGQGQIEFFTSGYYEPILAVIPEKDAELQLKKTSDFLYNNFGVIPKGLWLTERVWNDQLIKLLVNNGIEYVIVDDFHFLCVGFEETKLQGFFLTESEGITIKIFPINKKLRYLIPFHPIEEVFNCLQKLECGIIFDDGEKFGLWPKTYEWVYEKNWLKKFFECLSSSNKIKTVTFEEYVRNNDALGRVYLPDVSYFEMGEWSLTYEQGKKFKNIIKQFKDKENFLHFFRGGIWKNYFIKYEESNTIHKKMLKLSNMLTQKDLNNEATEFLLQSQCNDCLWHGVFGGIYLPNLRNNAYLSLNKLENLINRKDNNVVVKDFNYDGYKEIEYSNNSIILGISPKYGGALYEFSDRNSCFNIQNTLTRRKELYHDDIEYVEKKEDDDKISTIHEMEYKVNYELQKYLIFDTHLKYSLIDKFFSKKNKFENYKKNNYSELGNFVGKEYFLKSKQPVLLFRESSIRKFGKSFLLEIEKSFYLEENQLEIIYNLKNKSYLFYDIYFCCEINMFFPGHNNINSFIQVIDSNLKIEQEIEAISLKNIKVFDAVMDKQILIKSDKSFKLWSFPFYTISKSEKGFEKIYQGTTFGLLFPFDSKYNEIKNFNIIIQLN